MFDVFRMMGLSVGVILFAQVMICKYFFYSSPENKQKATLVVKNRYSLIEINLVYLDSILLRIERIFQF